MDDYGPNIKFAVYIVIIEDTNEALENLSHHVVSLEDIDMDLSFTEAVQHIDDIKRWAKE